MSISTDIMPPPEIKPYLPPPNKFDQERVAFRKMLPKLLEQYRGKFVAIHEEKVVGTGDDLVSVAMAAYKQFGYVPIYVDLVTDEFVRPVRIPHFKPL